MSVRVCSLLTNDQQVIPNDGAYHIVRFPYAGGAGVGESYDAWDMHDPTQPDGGVVDDWATDDRSGLIHPSVDGWGMLTAMVYWAAGDYSEVRDRFVRDPLGVEDSTATEDYTPTPGGQFRHKTHQIFVHPNVPLAFKVKAWGGMADGHTITHAQFKLAILPYARPDDKPNPQVTHTLAGTFTGTVTPGLAAA